MTPIWVAFGIFVAGQLGLLIRISYNVGCRNQSFVDLNRYVRNGLTKRIRKTNKRVQMMERQVERLEAAINGRDKG